MAMMKISRDVMPALYARIAAEQSLLLPVKTAGQTNFALWNENADVDLYTLKTVKRPRMPSSPRARPSTPVPPRTRRSPSPPRS